MPRHILSLLLVLTLALPLYAQSPAQDLAKGDTALNSDDYKSAEKHFDHAIRTSQGDANIEASAFHGRGIARLELHNWSGAKSDLNRAVELDSTNAGAFAARGMARKALGDYDGLLLDAREAARLNPREFNSFEEDAKSTVLYRRMMLVFLGLAGILVVIGGVVFARILVRVLRAERDANRAAN